MLKVDESAPLDRRIRVHPGSSPRASRWVEGYGLGEMAEDDLAERVRRGYDEVSYRYRADDADEGGYRPWIERLLNLVPARGSVLDLACGCGVPVAQSLAAAGRTVMGVDISEVQIERARRLVPGGTFVRADAAMLRLAPRSFDAVVCLYSLIHIDLAIQERLLSDIGGWLRPGGWLVAAVGERSWSGSQVGWLGGRAEMWWSHADAATYRGWIESAGLKIDSQQFVPDGESGHALFWAQRPSLERANA